MINREKLEFLVESFNERRNAFIIQAPKEMADIAAFNFDMSQEATTNRSQLESIGVDCSNVYGNLEEIVEALELIGVKLMFKNMPRSIIAEIVSKAIEDVVPNLWNGENLAEFIDLDPKGEFLSQEDREIKLNTFGDPQSNPVLFTTKEEFKSQNEILSRLCDGRLDL